MFAGRKASASYLGTRSSMLAVLCKNLPMVRLRAGMALALIALASACTGEIVDPGGATPTELAIAAFERDVAPVMSNKCAVCHTAADKPQFMKPNPTLREGIMSYRNTSDASLLDLMSPIDSRLQVYSSSEAHLAVGPNFSPSEAAKVTAWVELEALAAGVEEQPEVKTGRVAPVIGTNMICLGLAPPECPDVGIGLTGSKFYFDFERITTGYYLSRIKVTAGTGGMHLVDPLFVVWNGETAVPDPINRFAGIDLVVEDTMESQVGGGTAIFTFPPQDLPAMPQLSVHFKTATFANGMMPTENGGSNAACKAVPLFTSTIKPLLQPCLMCHAGMNAQATGATDMTKVNDDAAQLDACNQILTRISKANPNQSSIIVSVDPSQTIGHAMRNYKVPAGQFSAYQMAMVMWINAEAAP